LAGAFFNNLPEKTACQNLNFIEMKY